MGIPPLLTKLIVALDSQPDKKKVSIAIKKNNFRIVIYPL